MNRSLLLSVSVFAGVALVGVLPVGCSDDASSAQGSPDAATSNDVDASRGDVDASTDTDAGVDGDATTDAASDAKHAGPPAAGPTQPADGTGPSVFAMKRLYVGDVDRFGAPDKVNGWKSFGYDIDGKISTATSTDLCAPLDNASKTDVYPDGNDGTDNSFGANLLPIFTALDTNFSQATDIQIKAGLSTLLFSVEKLGPAADYNPVIVQAYVGANLGDTPKFDGSDAWPVAPESLSNPSDLSQGSKTQFANSYVVGNTVVMKGTGPLNVPVVVSSYPLTFVIQNPIITFVLSADHKSATNGTISGVLDTAQLSDSFRTLAARVDPTFCSGSTIDSIINQIAQASDILSDGTQDPTKSCTGISVGLGFDLGSVTLGPIAPKAPVMPNPCL